MKEDNKWINMVYILSIIIMYDFVEVWWIVSQRILHFCDVIPLFFCSTKITFESMIIITNASV